MPGFHTNQTPTPPSARLHSAGSPHQCTGSHDWHHEGSHDLKHRSLGLETPHPSGSLRQKIATSHNGSPCSLLDRGKKPKKWVESTNYRWTCSLFVLFFFFPFSLWNQWLWCWWGGGESLSIIIPPNSLEMPRVVFQLSANCNSFVALRWVMLNHSIQKIRTLSQSDSEQVSQQMYAMCTTMFPAPWATIITDLC